MQCWENYQGSTKTVYPESNVNSWNKKSSNSRIIFQERHVVFKRDILIPTRYLYLEKNLDLLFVWLSRFSFSEGISSPLNQCSSSKYILHLRR